jgi:hypothetical protein
MAQLDASIYNALGRGVKSPEEYQAERQGVESNALSLRAMQSKMAQEQAAAQRQGQLQNLLAGGADANALMRGGFMDEAAKRQTMDTGAAQEDRAAKKFQIEQARSQVERAAQLLGSARDQASYNQARMAAQAEGLDMNGVPDQFDPAWVAQTRRQYLTIQQQLEQHWKQMGYDLDVRQQSEVERNNATQNAISRGNLAVSQGNLGLSRQRLELERQQPKGQYDAERGVIVDPRTGEARPVLMGGKPLPVSSKQVVATEDERKAAGWYNQAENAWKNMQAAMGGIDPKTGRFKNEDVARPGMADAIAAVPSFGLGEVVGNTMRGPERQKFMQAASSLSEAVLRAATGAGVNKDEAVQKVRELTPVFGEDPATTKQKMDSIPMYLNSLKQRAGRAMPQGGGAQPGGAKFLGFE